VNKFSTSLFDISFYLIKYRFFVNICICTITTTDDIEVLAHLSLFIHFVCKDKDKSWKFQIFSQLFGNGTTIRVSFDHHRIFLKKGCQGDRMPIYKAFAPFLEGDKGDRRVTGLCAHSLKKGRRSLFTPLKLR
jgi:hypothetical protein